MGWDTPRRIAAVILLIALAGACRSPEDDRSDARLGPGRPEVRLRHIEGSSVKVEQLVGDADKETKKPTFNLTASRYGILGTDLGHSFEHNGKAYFLFGDTVGRHGGDVIGVSTSTNPEGPLALDFLTNGDGSYLRVEPPGVSMEGNEVPVAGISLGGVMYVAVKTNYTRFGLTETTLLTSFDESKHAFTVLRELSRMPVGRFITMSFVQAPAELQGMPYPGPQVLMFGSGQYRRSNAYLSTIPVSGFASGEGTRYFAGLSAEGQPIWSDYELASAPIIEHSTIGDLSVQYVRDLGLWIAVYDSRSPRGIVLRYAQEPWGPWSSAQIIFEPIKDDAWGVFIHNPKEPADGLGGPVIGPNADAMRTQGGYYAPYLIERFTRVENDQLTLQYVLSTWNPYVVVRMRSSLAIERGKLARTQPVTGDQAELVALERK
ncbi:MAG TPA: DUF4185 domain-containing protein [Dehalococcoidia bacterium]|nr:DUF4185 domain-containing protein [Dehalococcoidia bacterium]